MLEEIKVLRILDIALDLVEVKACSQQGSDSFVFHLLPCFNGSIAGFLQFLQEDSTWNSNSVRKSTVTQDLLLELVVY